MEQLIKEIEAMIEIADNKSMEWYFHDATQSHYFSGKMEAYNEILQLIKKAKDEK